MPFNRLFFGTADGFCLILLLFNAMQQQQQQQREHSEGCLVPDAHTYTLTYFSKMQLLPAVDSSLIFFTSSRNATRSFLHIQRREHCPSCLLPLAFERGSKHGEFSCTVQAFIDVCEPHCSSGQCVKRIFEQFISQRFLHAQIQLCQQKCRVCFSEC